MIRVKHAVLALAALAAIAACGNNGNEADPPVGGLQVAPGDGVVTVTWNDDLGINYWLFVSTDSTMTVDNFSTRTDIRVLRNVRSPTTLCGYPDGRTLYFAMNGRTQQGPGGPGTPTVNTTLRVAGNTWTAGAIPAADWNAVGYAPLTTCQQSSLPTGVFTAVGPGGAIASGTDGRTFTARTAPTGFTSDLNAVASFTTSIDVPTAPGLTIVAVGAGGASVVSSDGSTWTTGVAFNAALPTLRAVANNIGTFIAVGDGGAAQTSTDGVTWTPRSTGTTGTLRAIHCNGSVCVAVGDGGSVVRSIDSGATWSLQPITGSPAFRAVMYGNFNNNIGATTTVLNTWVAVGDGGVAYYSLDGGLTWTSTTVAGAGNLVGVSYLTRFAALDAGGSAWFSLDGITWTGPAATGLTAPSRITVNGVGYVAVGAGGQTASSF